MDGLSVLASTLGNGGMVWILACVLLLLFPRTRRIGSAVALALVIEALSCAALKMMVARPRPFMIDRDIKLLIAAPADYSFPSGHTGASFAAAYAMRSGGWKLSPGLPACLDDSILPDVSYGALSIGYNRRDRPRHLLRPAWNHAVGKDLQELDEKGKSVMPFPKAGS